jgi:uncharacterized membrane protein
MANPEDELKARELEALRAQIAALTERVHALEVKSELEPQRQAVTPPANLQANPPDSRAGTSPVPPPRPPRQAAQTYRTPASALRNNHDLEGTIGRLWFNRVGIFALLFGVAFFLKYAFENNWIGPSVRVVLGLLAGIAVIIWSERFRNRGSTLFSYSLKAVGVGTLYLSTWGAYQVYHLVPSEAAFFAMIAVAAFTVILAVTQEAEILAVYAMVGGFLTPVLLSTGENHEAVLFTYLCLLDVAMLVIVSIKPWRRLMWGSFAGTWSLYAAWFGDYYTQPQRPLTVFFASLFFTILAAVPLLTPLTRSRWHKGFSVTLTLLPLANAAAFFVALCAMYWNDRDTLTWYALGLAAAYLLLAGQFKRRGGSEPQTLKLTTLLHIAIAIGFVTIAIPLKLHAHWVTIGWLMEAAALLSISVPARANFLRYFASATLALAIFRLLVIDEFHVTTLLFNARFGTYLVAIGIMAGIVVAGNRFASEQEKPFVRIAGIVLNLLALIALSLEAQDYFARQLTAFHRNAVGGYGPFQQIEFARNFTFSAIWLAYGACLMAFGFWRRAAFVRWQALVLIAFTIGKVFLFDISSLGTGYRIVSFMALGVVLMAISYVYSRDWLKLSGKSADRI